MSAPRPLSKPILDRVRKMSTARKVVLGLYGWFLLGLLVWDVVTAIHLGWHTTVDRAVMFLGWCRLADLVLVPLIKRHTIRHLKRTVRDLRLLRDQRRKDPAADRELTEAIDKITQIVEQAKAV